MKSCKLCWGISVLLLAVILGGAYQFVLKGSTAESSDGRTAILLPGNERDFVLKEMREFLEGVRDITEAAGKDDLKAVAAISRKIGRQEMVMPPLSMMGKLPLEFKTLGFATHSEFDVLAEIAQKGDTKAVIAKLGSIMNNCVTCHSEYRIDPSGSDS